MQKTIKTLANQINQLRSEMNAGNQQMNSVPDDSRGSDFDDATTRAHDFYATTRLTLSKSAPDGDQSRFVFSQPAQEPAGRPQGEGEESTPRSGIGATPIIRHLLTSASWLTPPLQNTTSSPRTTRSRRLSTCSAKG